MVSCGDLLDLDGRAQLDLVAGDRRAPGEAGDLRVDRELVQHPGDRLDHRVVGAAAGLRHRAGGQQVAGRQLVGRLALAVGCTVSRSCSPTAASGSGSGAAASRRGGRRDGRGGRRRVGGPRPRAPAGSRSGSAVDVGDRRPAGAATGGAAATGSASVTGSARVRLGPCLAVGGVRRLVGAGRAAGAPGRAPAHGVAGEQQERVDRQQHEHRHGHPRGEPGGQRGGREVADRAAAARPQRRARRARPAARCTSPSTPEGEQQRADGDPRPRLRAAASVASSTTPTPTSSTGSTTAPRPTTEPMRRGEPPPDRAARAPPDPGRADDGQHEQHDAEAVAAVRGVELAGPADGAAAPPGPAGRSPRPTAVDGRGRAGPGPAAPGARLRVGGRRAGARRRGRQRAARGPGGRSRAPPPCRRPGRGAPAAAARRRPSRHGRPRYRGPASDPRPTHRRASAPRLRRSASAPPRWSCARSRASPRRVEHARPARPRSGAVTSTHQVVLARHRLDLGDPGQRGEPRGRTRRRRGADHQPTRARWAARGSGQRDVGAVAADHARRAPGAARGPARRCGTARRARPSSAIVARPSAASSASRAAVQLVELTIRRRHAAHRGTSSADCRRRHACPRRRRSDTGRMTRAPGPRPRDAAPAPARRRLRPRPRHPRQPRLLARRRPRRHPLPRPVQLLRLRTAGHEPPGADRRPRRSWPSWPRWRSTSRRTPTSTRVRWRAFVETFARVLGDPALPHLFFVEGGALAVENALKTAFDWKRRHNADARSAGDWARRCCTCARPSTAAAATRSR